MTEAGAPERKGFIRRYVFSTDHKVVGIQYALTASFFFIFGFTLILLMRWQLAYPEKAIPILENYLGEENVFMPGGVIQPDFYNSLGAMHGTVMVFLAVVPFLLGGFGNYFVPLQIGAREMAFPRMNMLSFWTYVVGGLIMLYTFVLPDGPPNSGWTSYPPLSIFAADGQTLWLLGMVFIILSSMLGNINLISTVMQLRTVGMTFFRMPFFVWTLLVSSFLLLLAFPPLAAAAIFQLSDRLLDTSFFLPSGLVVSDQPLDVSGGGSPLLYQHLFWFLAHPEVYVLVLPALGIVAEVVSNNCRRPLWGYKPMAMSAVFLGFFSCMIWAHHMYLTGMGTTINTIFEITTLTVSIPSLIILTCLVATLWGASIRFTVPMLFALAFMPMFGIGGFTGLPLALSTSDIQLHDTYYVLGHFHYIIAPGTIFAIFAGVYYWFPKVTGRMTNTWLGHLHFWPSLIFMNGIFFSMLIQGMAGVNRRLYDGGATYAHAQDVLFLNKVMTHSAYGLAVVQIFFCVNIAWSLVAGRKVSRNPWGATTLEWDAPSPPVPDGNFEAEVAVHRAPYEYSVPGASSDFTPQSQGGA
jgi:cytochrome c oxidase subunit I